MGKYINTEGLTHLADLLKNIYAAKAHKHVIADVTNLQTTLNGKAATSHTHTIANVTDLQDTLNGKAASSHSHSAATTSASGFMSSADKSKLDGIASGANKTTVDSALSSTSTNPVQNKVINSALSGKASSSHTHTIANVSGLQSALDGKSATSHTHTPNAIGAYSLSTNKTAITASADLNTYKTPGTYVMATDANAKTLKNCPTGGFAFTLWVDAILASSTYLIQTAQRYSDGCRWNRVSVDGGSTWKSWYEHYDSAHKLEFSDITGTLPISHGGTGGATLDDARKNLGIKYAPAGIIYPYAGKNPPVGYLLCDGTAVSRSQYAELFAVIGTTYGTGNGTSTFNLPDLRTRVPIGADSANYQLGSKGGEATHKLTQAELPNYTIPNVELVGTTNDIYCNRLEPSGIITAKTALDKRSYAFSGESNRWADYTIDASHSHSSGGSDKAHNNMQPYTVINYIISTGETTNDVAAANITYPLAVSYGGTGSSSKTEALKNLGVTVSTSTAPETGSPMSVHIQILD